MPAFSDRIIDCKFFFIPQKVIELPDGHQMTVNRLGCQLFFQQMIDVLTYFLVRYLLDRLIYPYNELFEIV